MYFRFFKSKDMTHFSWSVFIMTFGESLINIFVPIYLYNLGFQIPEILFFYFLVSLYFIVFSYFGAKITAKIWVKHTILVSTPFLIIYYIGLIFIDLYAILLLVLPLLLALRMILFNYGYHLNFINHSNQAKRGNELALFGIIKLLATMAAPYLWGLLATFNFSLLFIISSLMITLGTIPLFFTKDKFEEINFSLQSLFKKILSKNNRGNFLSFSGYAIESIIGRTIWPIFLIIIIGTINKTGLIISLSMFISLLAFHYVGKLTDSFNKHKLLKIWTVLYVFAWVWRIFADTTFKVLFIDSYKNLSQKILHLPRSAHSYDLAKRQDHFEFIVSREIIFNIIRIIIFPILIGVFWFDIYPFILSFIIASIFSIGYIFIDK